MVHNAALVTRLAAAFLQGALRRDRVETEEDFPRDVAELQRLLGPTVPCQRVVAMPGAGTQVPIWLLGSSLFSASLAAERGVRVSAFDADRLRAVLHLDVAANALPAASAVLAWACETALAEPPEAR